MREKGGARLSFLQVKNIILPECGLQSLMMDHGGLAKVLSTTQYPRCDARERGHAHAHIRTDSLRELHSSQHMYGSTMLRRSFRKAMCSRGAGAGNWTLLPESIRYASVSRD